MGVAAASSFVLNYWHRIGSIARFDFDELVESTIALPLVADMLKVGVVLYFIH